MEKGERKIAADKPRKYERETMNSKKLGWEGGKREDGGVKEKKRDQ